MAAGAEQRKYKPKAMNSRQKQRVEEQKMARKEMNYRYNTLWRDKC